MVVIVYFFKMLMSVPKDYTTALLMICATIPGAHLFVLVSKLIHYVDFHTKCENPHIAIVQFSRLGRHFP